MRYREHVMERVSLRGVTRDYLQFSTYAVERGRPISPTEIDRDRPVAMLGWEVANRLFKETDPLDKMVSVGGIHFRVVGVAEKKGSFFGSSQDEYAVAAVRRPAAVLRRTAVADADRQAVAPVADARRDGGDPRWRSGCTGG